MSKVEDTLQSPEQIADHLRVTYVPTYLLAAAAIVLLAAFIVSGKGREVDDMVAGVQSCYDSHTEEHKNTDEFMEPLVNGNIDGRIREGDVVIFFNFRSDRAKELTTAMPTMPSMPTARPTPRTPRTPSPSST